MVRQRCAFDDPRLAELNCYFDLPLTFFAHFVAQKLPN